MSDVAPPVVAPVAAPAPVVAPEAKTVALENFQAVVQAKNGLESQVAALKADLQRAVEKASTADTLATQVNEWKAKAEQAGARFETFTELSGALGTTDSDVLESFDARYRALPEANRPARSAWVETLKAKPEDAPPLLRPWLAGASATKPAPRLPGTTATAPAAGAAVTAEMVRTIREEAVRTGDWSKWKELRKSSFGGR